MNRSDPHIIEDSNKFIRTIRQCRPEKPLSFENYQGIGFFNKNRDHFYISYDDKSASDYLRRNFGARVRDAYFKITIPQARSDFFLVASLLFEGGISADVCSTCTAPVASLLQDPNKLHLVRDSGGYQKKFFYAPPNHPIIKKYFNLLLEKLESYAGSFTPHYEEFSSPIIFNHFFEQALADNLIDTSQIIIIPGDHYDAIIRNELNEEIFDQDGQSFARMSIRGVVDQSCAFSRAGYDRILGRKSGCFFKEPFAPQIIGHNRHPSLTRDVLRPISLPDLEVYHLHDVVVSGHACLWKEDTFLKHEVYLSVVAEEEAQAGFWKSPSELKPSRVIEEDVIVAFGAGYGCYGHYLVDEIPRLALAKSILGDRFFAKKLLVPANMPEWGLGILKFFLDLRDDMFITFDHRVESVHLQNAIIPNYVHKDYNFHPFIRDFFAFYKNNNPDRIPRKRLCLSRKSWEPTKSNQRVFVEQDFFEETARARGFEIVHPETLSIQDQINLLRETRCHVGEHGSAQHASLYNPHGATIGTINPLTEIQFNIGRLYNDTNIIAFADQEHSDENNNTLFSLSQQKIIEFFDTVERADEKRFPNTTDIRSQFDMARL